MNNSHLHQLAKIGSVPLSESDPTEIRVPQTIHARDLRNLLMIKNGFYAFEGALYVRSSEPHDNTRCLNEWNSTSCWIDTYGDLVNGLLFFAEDIFGNQFAITDNGIVWFDAETGNAEFIAENIEGWAAVVLNDYQVQTGYPVAHAWQTEHGPLPIGQRLVPKVPFVGGGGYDSANMYAVDEVRGMRVRGDLALQIRDLPDGAKIKYEVVE